MTTRNFGATNMGQSRADATRPSMASSSGNAVKSRQVVSLSSPPSDKIKASRR